MKATTGFKWTVLPLVAVLLGVTQANAQCAFDQSEPADGAVLDQPPASMTIKFLLGIHLQHVRLVGEDGRVWATDWTGTEENVFAAEFRARDTLPPGKYQIEWMGYIRQHYHGDGGVIPFTVAASAAKGEDVAVRPAAAPPAAAAPRALTGWPYRALRAGSAPPADR
jgi:methionine-rich copper-binding protein CopC